MKNFIFVFSFLISFFFNLSQAYELKPYTVYLKPGTVLTTISDNSEVILSKGIYTKVLELSKTRRDNFYVYDKNGVAKYIVNSLNIVEIAKDVSLLLDINAEKIYPEKSIFKTENKSAVYQTQLNLHFENIQLSELNNIYSDQIQNVLSTRYELRTLYITNLFFDFGLSLNYQSAYWNNGVEQLKLSILSLGPHFRYHAYKNENFNLNVLIGGELAPIYQGQSAQYTDKYSAMLYDIGVESEWDTFVGKLSLGSHFRHHSIALTESTRPNLQATPSEFSLNSFGIMIGYKLEWEL